MLSGFIMQKENGPQLRAILSVNCYVISGFYLELTDQGLQV